jgi:hypothetical protein
MTRTDATFVQCASFVHLPLVGVLGTSENIGSPGFRFFSQTVRVSFYIGFTVANLVFFSFAG